MAIFTKTAIVQTAPAQSLVEKLADASDALFNSAAESSGAVDFHTSAAVAAKAAEDKANVQLLAVENAIKILEGAGVTL